MRQIGQGQRIHLFVIPEVARLIQDHVKACGPGNLNFSLFFISFFFFFFLFSPSFSFPLLSLSFVYFYDTGFSHLPQARKAEEQKFHDVVGWLLLNSMRSEGFISHFFLLSLSFLSSKLSFDSDFSLFFSLI